MTKKIVIFNSFSARDHEPAGTVRTRVCDLVRGDILASGDRVAGTKRAADRIAVSLTTNGIPRIMHWAADTIVGVVRNDARQRHPVDGIGTPEEIAYGEGWHNPGEKTSPYTDPALTKAWERGKAAKKQKAGLQTHYKKGEIRGKGFQPPKAKQHDLKSERGFVAKIMVNGQQVARSEPYISETAAKKWIDGKVAEYARKGQTAKGNVAHVFYDPDKVM